MLIEKHKGVLILRCREKDFWAIVVGVESMAGNMVSVAQLQQT
jgi:hypothetical protein